MKTIFLSVALVIALMSSVFAQTATVELAWDPVDPVPNQTIHYTIHYGTSSGVYTASVNVGANPTGKVSGLSTVATYYFVVSASYASGGSRSGYSNEVSSKYEPPAELKPPYAIDGSTFKLEPNNKISFMVTGIPDGYCELETSTDLKTWYPLQELMFEAGQITQKVIVNKLDKQFFRAKWTLDTPTN